jgi:hypothetical protein
MKRYRSIITASLLLVAMLMASCAGPAQETPPGQTSPGETTNLRFLLSDDDNEATAVGDFESVSVTVSKIGFHRGGESGNWTEPEDYEPWTGDLLDLIGTNATMIWNGYIEPGYYTKAFIYVSNVTGNLTQEAGGGPANIRIPSEKLQITMPFTAAAGGAIVDYVFDITIIKAGKSGQYLIKPQVGESGPDKEYREVKDEHQGDSARERKFRGTILTIDDNVWTVSLGNEQWSVNVTEAEVEGTPAVGLKAKIEGVVGEDDIILASEVEIKEVEDEGQDDSTKKMKFGGTILTIDDNVWTVSLGNEQWSVNVTEAEIEGIPAVGLKAKIEGIVGEDDIILASEVEIEEIEDEE